MYQSVEGRRKLISLASYETIATFGNCPESLEVEYKQRAWLSGCAIYIHLLMEEMHDHWQASPPLYTVPYPLSELIATTIAGVRPLDEGIAWDKKCLKNSRLNLQALQIQGCFPSLLPLECVDRFRSRQSHLDLRVARLLTQGTTECHVKANFKLIPDDHDDSCKRSALRSAQASLVSIASRLQLRKIRANLGYL